MQALTPDVPDLIWQATKYEVALAWEHKEVIVFVVGGAWRGWKLLRRLPDEITARINEHAEKRMVAHEEKDDERFKSLDSRFAEMTRRITAINPLHRSATGD